MKIYVGCSLTHATQEFRDHVELLKEKLGEKYEVLKFLGFNAGTPEEIFDYDIKLVRSCDLMIAECSYPSIGLGIEIGIALERNTPLIAIAKEEAVVAKMVLGIANTNFSFLRYITLDSLLFDLDNRISSLFKNNFNVAR